MIKTQTNHVTKDSVNNESIMLLPPNDRRIAVIINCTSVGAACIGIGHHPFNIDDGIRTDNTLANANLAPLQLSIASLGTAIQQQINLYSDSIGLHVYAIEFLASP